MPTTSDVLATTHQEIFGGPPRHVVRAPGRVSLLGAHADYNEGFVLPVAIDRYTRASISPASHGGTTVTVHSRNLGESCQFDVAGEAHPLPPWGLYVRGVVEELKQRGADLPGFDLLIHGDIPMGSGLSSSASLTVATAAALTRLAGIEIEPLEMVRLCRQAEVVHAGVACGVMDPFAAYLGRRGRALLIDCRSLDHEEIPLPADLAIVILDSGVRRRLAASEFGSRRDECNRAVGEIRRLLGEPIRTLRDVAPDRLLSVIDRLPSPLRLRAAHVVSDLARAVRGADALRAGRIDEFGAAMYETHASLRELYQVSIPELDLLVEEARATPGVVGARLTGAGFGGCVVCVARRDAFPELERRILSRFRSRFERPPGVEICDSTDGALAGAVAGGEEIP